MGRPGRQLIGRLCLLGMLAAGLAGCSTLPGTAVPAGSPPTPPAGAGGAPTQNASSVLLEQSRAARAAGNLAAAATSLERALRIEPNDATLWLEYGELRMAQGDYRQAETLARKSASLAGDDRAMRDAATALIADARQAQGY